jgi:large subunit ribosomal protein L23
MKLEPILTEKSLRDAKEGRYTFRVDPGLTKHKIRKLVEEVFGVHVTKVRTIKEKGEVKRTVFGKKRVITPKKKAIVTLKEKEKIDLFEEIKSK